VDETSRHPPGEEGDVCECRAISEEREEGISKSFETLIGSESSLQAFIMILCVLFTNRAGNVLLERFHGLPAEERLHWRSFLVKLTTENLKTSRDDEVYVASHKSVFIVYTVIGDICIFAVGKEVYDELALMEVLNAVSASVKEVCKKAPSERLFLEKYGKVCLCLDEIVSQGSLEHTDKDRIRRLSRLKPLAES
jgi:hypothetical protein